MIRTLTTQMRVRRLLRTADGYVDRLSGAPWDRDTAELAARRVGALVTEAAASWSADLASAGTESGLQPIDRHMHRQLRELEGLAATLARPGVDLGWLAARLREVAVPLMVMLRGLEDVPAELLGAVAPAHDLKRIA